MDPRTGLGWLVEGLGQFNFQRSLGPFLRPGERTDITLYPVSRSAPAQRFQAPNRMGPEQNPQFIRVQVIVNSKPVADGTVSFVNLNRAQKYIGGPTIWPGTPFDVPFQPAHPRLQIPLRVPPFVMRVTQAQLPEVLRLLGLNLYAGINGPDDVGQFPRMYARPFSVGPQRFQAPLRAAFQSDKFFALFSGMSITMNIAGTNAQVFINDRFKIYDGPLSALISSSRQSFCGDARVPCDGSLLLQSATNRIIQVKSSMSLRMPAAGFVD